MEINVPAAAPLRRPRSPASVMPVKDEDESSGSYKKFSPGAGGRNQNRVNGTGSGPRYNRPGQGDRLNNYNRPQGQQRRPEPKDDDFGFKGKPANTPPKQEEPRRQFDSPARKPEPIAAKATPPTAPATNQAAVKPPPTNQVPAKTATNQQPPGSLSDVTPGRKWVPKNCVIDTLSAGDCVVVSVESNSESGSSAGGGFVCVSLHENFQAEYESLCGPYAANCETDTASYTPTPGETFSYLNPEDGAWYRARCLSRTSAALLDCGSVVSLTPTSKCTRLSAQYQAIPEFCCFLQADVKIGDNLRCTLVEKKDSGWLVSVTNAETEASLGHGTLTRWITRVEHTPTVTKTAPPSIPEVPRPPVTHGSLVVLAHLTDLTAAFVRPAAAADNFETLLQDSVLYGRNTPPLKEPPTMGQYVMSRYTDGNHYRALVKRTNVKQNKYFIEYLEFGNTQVNPQENLLPCPDSLHPDKVPVMTSRVALLINNKHPTTPQAINYIDHLKDDNVTLILTIPSGEKQAPSGCEVLLTVSDTKEAVNKKIEQMCTPDWVRMQQQGADVVESECIMYSELEYVSLPSGPSTLQILDSSTLAGGILTGCQLNEPLLETVLTTLAEQMGEYCESELGREPYLPKAEELCIAQLPPFPQWYRAVLAEQINGPGGEEAEVVYIDYGNMARVPTNLLRKMLPDFVKGIPALANTLEIKDFPENPTPEQLVRAKEHLELNDEGQGTIKVTKIENTGPGLYVVHAPELIAALKG